MRDHVKIWIAPSCQQSTVSIHHVSINLWNCHHSASHWYLTRCHAVIVTVQIARYGAVIASFIHQFMDELHVVHQHILPSVNDPSYIRHSQLFIYLRILRKLINLHLAEELIHRRWPNSCLRVAVSIKFAISEELRLPTQRSTQRSHTVHDVCIQASWLFHWPTSTIFVIERHSSCWINDQSFVGLLKTQWRSSVGRLQFVDVKSTESDCLF